MKSNKNIQKELSEILKFEGEDEKFEFEVSTLHFDFMEEIQKLMNEHSIRNTDLAKMLKVSESFISQLFSGEKLLNLKLLTKIQKQFNIRFKISSQQKEASQQVFIFVTSHKTTNTKNQTKPLFNSLFSTNESLQLSLSND